MQQNNKRRSAPPTVPAPISQSDMLIKPPASGRRETIPGIPPIPMIALPWELAAIAEFENAIALLKQGLACKCCMGLGYLHRFPTHVDTPYAVACPSCAGQGKGRR